MLEREGFPPGVPAWIDTTQRDVDAATAFYGGIFGWQFDCSARAATSLATLEGRPVAGMRAGGSSGLADATWTTYVGTEDASATAAMVRAASGSVVVDAMPLDGAGRAAAAPIRREPPSACGSPAR